MKRANYCLCLIIVCIVLSCFGCGKKKALQVGYIDTDQLVMKWDKYKDFSEEFARDQQKFYNRLPKDPKEISQSDQIEIMNIKEKWKKIKKDLREEIRGAAKLVAKEKSLDLIIDNSASAPVIEYGGKDVTNEVLRTLKKLTREGKEKE